MFFFKIRMNIYTFNFEDFVAFHLKQSRRLEVLRGFGQLPGPCSLVNTSSRLETRLEVDVSLSSFFGSVQSGKQTFLLVDQKLAPIIRRQSQQNIHDRLLISQFDCDHFAIQRAVSHNCWAPNLRQIVSIHGAAGTFSNLLQMKDQKG